MGNSKRRIHGFGDQLSPLTPGPWGHNDAGDPNAKRAVLADTPGVTGMRDAGLVAAGGSVCEPYEFVRRRMDDIPLIKLQRDEWYADAGLTIRGNEDFIGATLGHLGQIKATRCGALLLEQLKILAGRKVHGLRFLILSEDGGRSAEALNKPDAYPKGAQIRFWTDASHAGRSCFTGTGVGSDVVIHHNHTLYRNENGQDVPQAIGLAHELVHAWHQAAGTLATGWKDNVWNYERQSVGIGEYDKCAGGCSGHVTENCIRGQWKPKLNPRTRYGGEAKGLEPDF